MIGREILNYRIEKKIGEGGMGTVYFGRHTKIDRKVAIKVLHSHLVKSDAIRHRFMNEANTMAAIQHPNIVQLYDYVEIDGDLFLIMEYIQGMSIDDFIKQISGPIPEDKAVIMFRQILDAMSYAHRKNIIHRDVKPGNFIIKPDGQIKILDFGIAKIMDKEEYNLTQTGGKVGTVLYMSPEQVQGKPLDNRSDIFALGITLFQMLTARVPYYDIESEFDIQYAIVSKPLPRMKNIYPNVSNFIQRVVDKATEKKPENRFQNCQEFKQALNRPKPVSTADHLKRIFEDNLENDFPVKQNEEKKHKKQKPKTKIVSNRNNKSDEQVDKTVVQDKTLIDDKTIVQENTDTKIVESTKNQSKHKTKKEAESKTKTTDTKKPKKKRGLFRKLFKWIVAIAIVLIVIKVLDNIPKETDDMGEEDYVERAENIMSNYYSSFRDKSFDAKNFFADTVKKYIMMRNTNPVAINKNIEKYYYKEFRHPKSEVEDGTMTLESDTAGIYKFSCIVRGKSYRRSKKKYNFTRSFTEIAFNRDFDIISYSYSKVLEDEMFETEEKMNEYIEKLNTEQIQKEDVWR